MSLSGYLVDNAEYAFNRIPVAFALKVLRFGNDLEVQQEKQKCL